MQPNRQGSRFKVHQILLKEETAEVSPVDRVSKVGQGQ